MALDGLFMHKLAEELLRELSGGRVEKIYQPSKEELVFVMRTKQGSKKLYFNARADAARVHITEQSFINPPNPPMLCMLLRKRFNSARLENITQSGFERILRFSFTALNDFGDRVDLHIICEIMGRYSNIIFTDASDTVIDCVKRVGSNLSSVRELLPGKVYVLPPAQDKLLLDSSSIAPVIARISAQKNVLLSKAILRTVQGISPLRCTETAFAAYGEDKPVYEILNDLNPLERALKELVDALNQPSNPCALRDDSKYFAFSFAEIRQFASFAKIEYFESLSALLDVFFKKRIDTVKRTQAGGELLKKLHTMTEKLARKTRLLQKELAEGEDAHTYKLYAELINANLFYLQANVGTYEVLNYYDGQMISIPADRLLTPSENAARYYKEYRKKQNAKCYLSEQIRIAEEQTEYLESVLDLLERAETPEEIAAIKAELVQLGYLKTKMAKKEKAPKELKPIAFLTSGGYRVLVGRNNLSNDKLTFKTAGAKDVWFHAKNIHGSHTVLMCEGGEVPQEDLIQAAAIAAYYSKARESENVPVDYTRIKFVKRQAGNIPGRVFYTDYKTLFVNPIKEEIERMKQ